MALTIVENGALFAAHHSRNAKARSAREFLHLPLDRINWKTSSFLIGTDRVNPRNRLVSLEDLPGEELKGLEKEFGRVKARAAELTNNGELSEIQA
jgi:hypothetical protein